MRWAKSGAAVSSTTLRTRGGAAMGLRVIMSTSRQFTMAGSSSPAALPTCQVPPRMVMAKFCVIRTTFAKHFGSNFATRVVGSAVCSDPQHYPR